MIVLQHNQIHVSFGQSITILKHKFKKNNLYLQLTGNISRARLNFIYHEVVQVEKTSPDCFECGCTLRKIYNLPCDCVIFKNIKLDKLIKDLV